MSNRDPMPLTLPNVRQYLIDEALVRDPRTAGTLPPCWINPSNGVPEPGQSPSNNPVEAGDPVIAIFRQPGIAPRPYESFIRTDAVEFVIRASLPVDGENFEKDVRAVLNDKRGWQMAQLPVNESMIFRDLQQVGSGPTGFIFTFEYMFTVWGPFVPVG